MKFRSRHTRSSPRRCSVALALYAGSLLTGCGNAVPAPQPPTMQTTATNATLWRVLALGSEDEIISQVLAFGADRARWVDPFTTAWRLGATEEIEWVLPDGTALELSAQRLTALQSALSALRVQADLAAVDHRAALDGVTELGERMCEASRMLPPAQAGENAADAYLAKINTMRARLEVQSTGILLQRLALEALQALPADKPAPEEIESRSRALKTERANLARDLEELEAAQRSLPKIGAR